MKKLMFLLQFAFILFLGSCGGDECQECTGTLNNGNPGDFTICDNEDGTTTRTNNIDNTVTTDSTGYVEGIAFFESLGLDCQ